MLHNTNKLSDSGSFSRNEANGKDKMWTLTL